MSTSEQDEKDLQELREYMEGTQKSLRPDRSTASYALEFLKTERANYQYHAARSNMTQAVAQLEMARGWVERALTELLKLEKDKPQ
jgi:hypothetical protein